MVGFGTLARAFARFFGLATDECMAHERKSGDRLPSDHPALETAIASLNDGFAIMDPGGDFIEVNEAFARLHQSEDKEEFCKRLRAKNDDYGFYTLEGTAMPEYDQPIRRALRGEILANYEVALKKEDSGERWIISYSCTPIRDEDGNIVAAVATARDTTGQRRAREALSESEGRYFAIAEELRLIDRRKNEFLAVLSHELRNPLTPIRAGLQILQRFPLDGEQAGRALEILDRQVGQLLRLVDDLLDVIRIRQDKMQLQRRQVDLNELVRRLVEDHRSLFEQCGVGLEAEFSPCPVFVQADEIRLAQAVGNLLQNAAKFTEPDGKTRISVGGNSAKKRAVIRVSDTGAGIPRGMLHRLFQPFMQADVAPNRNHGGLGLGLALAKGLVELHGGDIHAYSSGPNRGSEFVVRLPLDETSAEDPPEVLPPLHQRSRRVLIIEDNIDLAQSLRELLELDGHLVSVAYSGFAGLAKAREIRPEIVLCDIGLPEMDGYAVARAFRADEKLRDIFLVALTGYAQVEDSQLAIKAGFDRHLAKPPDLAELERVLAVSSTEE